MGQMRLIDESSSMRFGSIVKWNCFEAIDSDESLAKREDGELLLIGWNQSDESIRIIWIDWIGCHQMDLLYWKLIRRIDPKLIWIGWINWNQWDLEVPLNGIDWKQLVRTHLQQGEDGERLIIWNQLIRRIDWKLIGWNRSNKNRSDEGSIERFGRLDRSEDQIDWNG